MTFLIHDFNVLVRADKGCVNVLINTKDDYKTIKHILLYRKTRLINFRIIVTKDLHYGLWKNQYCNISTFNDTNPRLYGLDKIHKPDNPL